MASRNEQDAPAANLYPEVAHPRPRTRRREGRGGRAANGGRPKQHKRASARTKPMHGCGTPTARQVKGPRTALLAALQTAFQ